MTTLIQNGFLCDPAGGREGQFDLLIQDGKIAWVGKEPGVTADQVVDATGLTVLPGLVDMHVHLRDPGFTQKEDILTGCEAAAAGGVTSLLCMPNTKPAVDSVETVEYIRQKAEAAKAHVYVTGAITKGLSGQELTDMAALQQAGCIAFSDDGRPVENAAMMTAALKLSKELGTIVKPPPIGDKIAIAGRVWVVEEVDHRRREVCCTLVKGNIPAYFGDVTGDIHTRILERMYGVLKEQNSYPYLMRHAVCRLQEARESFAKSGMRDHPLVHLGGNMWALFPWLGSYAFLALERMLKIRCKQRLGLKGLDSLRPYYLQFTMKVSASDFYRIMAEEAEQDFDPLELVYPNEVPNFEKYDEYVPAELVRKGFALGVLDVEGMKQSVRSWSRYVRDN